MRKSLPVILGLSAILCFAGLAQAAPGSGNQWQNGYQYQQTQPVLGNQWQNGQGAIQNNFQSQQSSKSQKSVPRVLVNGRNIDFDVAPTIENNRTLVPIRSILEALGLEVSWDAAAQTVIATNGDIEVKLVIDGKAYVNGKSVNLDTPAKIINGRTMVPVRFMSEAMGWQVGWDDDTQTITIINGEEVDDDDSDELSEPEDLEASAVSSSRINLTWDAVSNADYYYVYRSTSYSGSYSKIGTATTESYKDTGLSSDTKYYYKVKAVGSSGTSDYSSVAYATTESAGDSDELSEPEDLEASAVSSSRINLTWDAVSDADYYYVYRSTSYSGSYSKIGTATTESYKDTGLLSDTTYYYVVKAINSYGASDASSVAYATTESAGDSDELSEPEDLEASAVSSSRINLTWDAVSNADYYYVYRSTSYSGSYSKIGTATTESYKDTGLSSDTTYYYKIKAVNSYGSSSYSSVAYATTD